MPYRIAGIDVHKKKLAVGVADVEVEDEYQFERRWYGSNPEQLRLLTEWLIEEQVEEIVLESTAQYWKPVWAVLERYWKPKCPRQEEGGMSGTLHLAQALSNRGRRGRKRDFRDAERLVKRLVSQELVLSFVPDPEQRLWRTVTRTKYQLRRDKVRLQNQLEALLECLRPASSQRSVFVRRACLHGEDVCRRIRRMEITAAGPLQPGKLGALLDTRERDSWLRSYEAVGLARFAFGRGHAGIGLGPSSEKRRVRMHRCASPRRRARVLGR
jgi:transposase